MKNARLMSILVTGASAIGFTAVVASAQYSLNPRSTGIEYANNPFLGDNAESIGMRQTGERPNQQMPTARVAYIGQKGAIDIALENIAATQSIRKMLDARVAVAEIDSIRYETRMLLESYVVARIAATNEAIDSLVQTTSEHLTGETRAQAVRRMRRQEENLEMALFRARRSDQGQWFMARAEVASDYQQFADAAGHAEDVAKGVVTVTSGVGITGSALLVLDN